LLNKRPADAESFDYDLLTLQLFSRFSSLSGTCDVGKCRSNVYLWGMSEFERVIPCAIYTPKSTEEGPEQEFNTLQAQREAAEAYIQL
jgi:hypothetical protein